MFVYKSTLTIAFILLKEIHRDPQFHTCAPPSRIHSVDFSAHCEWHRTSVRIHGSKKARAGADGSEKARGVPGSKNIREEGASAWVDGAQRVRGAAWTG